MAEAESGTVSEDVGPHTLDVRPGHRGRVTPAVCANPAAAREAKAPGLREVCATIALMAAAATGTVGGYVGSRTLGAHPYRGPHVTLTLFANRAASGASAAVIRALTGAPERAQRAAWRGMVARMPPPTARWVSGGEGLRVAWR